jgi:hypothetical protein
MTVSRTCQHSSCNYFKVRLWGAVVPYRSGGSLTARSEPVPVASDMLLTEASNRRVVLPPKEERTPRHFDALCAPEPKCQNGPLTPALSLSEGERGNPRPLSGETRFMGRAKERTLGHSDALCGLEPRGRGSGAGVSAALEGSRARRPDGRRDARPTIQPIGFRGTMCPTASPTSGQPCRCGAIPGRECCGSRTPCLRPGCRYNRGQRPVP